MDQEQLDRYNDLKERKENGEDLSLEDATELERYVTQVKPENLPEE